MAAAGVLAALAVATWAGTHRIHLGQSLDLTAVFPAFVLIVVVFSVAVPSRRFATRPMAAGKVVAVIPAFNEDADALHGTIRSLLASTRPPDEIHVVDDGSDEPIPSFEHPRVFWYRQLNAGKRRAQAHALRNATAVDFVLTVDSDCTVDRFAVQRLLQAMSDGDVQAATGLPLTRNRSTWLPRIIDLEIASICLTYRAARSRLGSLTTCSGALSMYRADVVLNNLDDYTSSTWMAGDDRRLTHYAMLRGKVVSVADAVVHTDMPDKIKKLFRQRVRWSTSHWRYFFWEIAHLPLIAMLWTSYLTVLYIIVPATLIWTLIVSPLLGLGFAGQVLAYWLSILWLVNIKYLVGRPHMPVRERLVNWAVGTPVLLCVHLLVLRPAMIKALFRTLLGHTRTATWGTRGATRTAGRYRLRPAGRYRGGRISILA
ncbi:glycosyltransferase [Actinobacteria bacterium YIM 96077]|uniref:Glycosyltransferase family 2 protein n=2 Tax=Phytoactinopolyspora halophila TaxID=1981511 RepID=A0A329R2Q6_9ACTN|nr:glycosyltransferase [Actinobacteria bacterium YIM 96077]RAW18860.1 glycosyltransferase family 2 protein [Phytoactinopolyspora halophila]